MIEEKMTIENAKYIKNEITLKNSGIQITVGGKEIGVPLDPANMHYAEIMRQVEAGTLTILPPDEPEETP